MVIFGGIDFGDYDRSAGRRIGRDPGGEPSKDNTKNAVSQHFLFILPFVIAVVNNAQTNSKIKTIRLLADG